MTVRRICAVPPPMVNMRASRRMRSTGVRVVGDPDRHFGGEDLGLCCGIGIGEGTVVRPARAGGGVDHQPCRIHLCRHVGQHPLQALEFRDGAPELMAVDGVVAGEVHCPGGESQRHGARPDTLAVIGIHQVGKATPETGGRQQHPVLRQFQVLEEDLRLRDAAQAHGRLPLPDPQARVLVADGNETADAQPVALRVQHPREDQMQAGDAAAGDPVLLAVQDIAVALFHGGGRHFRRGAARLRLGDADRGLVTVQHELGGHLSLGLGAILQDGGDRAHVGLHRDAPGDAADPRHLLDHQRGVEVAQARPTKLRWHGHAHEARVLQGRHIVPGILLAAIHFGGARRDGALRQVAGTGAQVLFGMAQG